MADTHRKVVADIGLIKLKATDPVFPPTYYIFGTAQLAWSVLQSVSWRTSPKKF